MLATSAMLNTVDILQFCSLLIVAGAVWRITRGGAGAAVQELTAANRVLERRVHALDGEVRNLRIENETLKQRTDFHSVMAQHEQRAQERADGLLVVLNLIADRLVPEVET